MIVAPRVLYKIAAACLLVMPAPAFSQSPTLGVGAPAPAFQVKWVKGEPVTSFDKETIYVFEFWATWCGPCRAAMPHLTELARTYSGKAVFIGVNIFERGGKDKPYESHYPAVKSFVDKMGDDMGYRVAMDTNDLPMTKKWMGAAGLDGIPASFVVKDGRILWIGHPSGLDKVLEEISKGTYDLSANAQKQKHESEEKRASAKFIDTLEKEVAAALAAKDYKKAIAQFEGATPRLSPDVVMYYQFLKLSTFLKSDVPLAMASAREVSAKDPGLGSMLAFMLLLSEPTLPVEAYPWCQENLETFLKRPGSPNPVAHHLIALCKSKVKDFTGAAISEQKALEIARAALAAGEQKDRVTAESISEYEAALADYTAHATPSVKP